MQTQRQTKITNPFSLFWSGLVVAGLSGYHAGCRSYSASPTVSATSQTPVSQSGKPFPASPPLSPEQARQRFATVLKQARFELNSQQPFQRVEIPLRFRQGLPFVQATWSGRPIECLVDTGSSTIMWPQWLQLDTQRLHIPGSQYWPEGGTTQSEWILTPRIAIGNLLLHNVPTEAIALPKPTASQPDRDSTPVLGLFAFTASIPTIDYAGKRLILRNRTYDVTRPSLSPGALLLRYQSDKEGRVVLPGRLAGHKARFLLDTASNGMYVTASFARNHLTTASQAGVPSGPSQGREASPPALANVSGTIAGLPFQAPTLFVIERAGGADVLVGSPLFLKYRVTIDRFRGVLLLEENRPRQGN